jgi:replicative DNA helicase
VFDAEGGGLLTMAGVRYGAANSSNIDLLLKGHVGEAVSQTRVGRDDVDLDHPVITIGVLSQPETLRQLVAVPGSAGRGLVDRFLIAAPPDKLGYRNHCTSEVRPEIRDAYASMVIQYATSLWGAEIQTLRFTADASDVIAAYQERSETRLRPGGDLRDMGGFGSKLVGSAVRLAALHHLATYGAQTAFFSQVGAASAEWGIRVAEWSLEHYRYAVAMAGDIADVADADRVLLWLQKNKHKQSYGVVAIRDITRGTGLKADQVEAAVNLLEQHNWVRPVNERRKTGPGRPAKSIEVHPTLRDATE